MNTLLLFLALVSINEKPAYRITDANGNTIAYEKMVQELSASDMVFFGELHNNSIAHWMELCVTEDLFKLKGQNLILTAEMLESDNQVLVDEYVSGRIKAKSFVADARLWPNHETDYAPLVDFARDNKLKFVAANIPRRYASLVNEYGFAVLDSLSPEAKSWIAPLPVAYDPEVPCYKKMMGMGGMMGKKPNENFPKAQAIKDATMAHFILKYWKEGMLALHFNGSYHSDYHEGTIWYLKQKNSKLRIKNITTLEMDDISKDIPEAEKGRADYYLLVPSNMTKTY
jgi:uncharacterized iron-regulated protein